MSQISNPYRYDTGTIAADASREARIGFIRKTYLHLAGAVGLFMLLEAWLLSLPAAKSIVSSMTGGWSWLIVLGLFMVVSWVAEKWARPRTSVAMQYAGLGLFIIAEAVIFLPLLWYAFGVYGENVIPTAAGITALVFCALTLGVFTTGKDFAFLGPALTLSVFVALGVIVCSILFGFDLGWIFTSVMIVVAGGYVLYTTSNVLHHYQVGQHVAASLALFAAVALLFWYILRLLMILQSDD